MNVTACGAPTAGGIRLDDALCYGCWQVARLVEYRAWLERLRHTAGLGTRQRKEQLMSVAPPTHQHLTDPFWQTCRGGQLRMAQYLLTLGADTNGTPSWARKALDAADGLDTGRQALLSWLRAAVVYVALTRSPLEGVET